MSAAAGSFWSAAPLGRGVEILAGDANGVAALAKPAGVLSHPNEAKDQPRSLIVAHYDAAEECYQWRVEGEGEPQRAWLLNRLDSATSGVILLANDAELAREIRAQFKRKQVTKIYQALV
ncbi:MAG TPA: pseudouridine synthase, partial [Opitutus sp.]|nr:pseudouridine synthase [Opitutus sp.]